MRGQTLFAVVIAGVVFGCGAKKTDADASGSAAATSTSAPSASVAAASASTPAPSASAASTSDFGPMVNIPAGTLAVGFACGAVPRVTDEELVNPTVSLGEYSIDVYPYPNDPTKVVKTGVTRDDAKGLCEAEGKRLCSELEWEHACKGPQNQVFDYGNVYDTKACPPTTALVPGARARCSSGFGVKDMHGLVFEWTSSPWGRGTSEEATTRGNFGTADVVHERCASGHGKAPTETSPQLGFRCCSGADNGALVDLTLTRDPPLSEDPKIDPALAEQMLRAMPQDHQAVADATVSFDKLWRWHPRANEEMLIARWTGRPKKGQPFFEIAVFKACNGVVGKVATMRGPVRKVGSPTVGTNLEQVSLDAETKTDKGSLKLDYWYGTVKIEQPTFVVTGNSLPDDVKKLPALVKLPPKK